jgi:inorganic triphosphatase YgiF
MLDLAALNNVDVWRELLKLDAKQLTPIFNTDFKRTEQEISWEGYRFEVVLDEGSVHVPNTGKSLDLHEIEIEYLGLAVSASVPEASIFDCPEAAMRELSAQLCACLPLAPADISKAQRGYALFSQCESTKQLK